MVKLSKLRKYKNKNKKANKKTRLRKRSVRRKKKGGTATDLDLDLDIFKQDILEVMQKVLMPTSEADIKNNFDLTTLITQGKSGKIYNNKMSDQNSKYNDSILKIVGMKDNELEELKQFLSPPSPENSGNNKSTTTLDIGIGLKFPQLVEKVRKSIKFLNKDNDKDKNKKKLDIYSIKFSKRKFLNYKKNNKLIRSLGDDFHAYVLRHNRITYDEYTKHFDMLCCLFDLADAYSKSSEYKNYQTLSSGGGNSYEINKPPGINEIIIQGILSSYLKGFGSNNKKLIDFKDFYITSSEIGIVQEKIGKQMDNFYISNLAEYIEYFVKKDVSVSVNVDTLFKHILKVMLGIDIKFDDTDTDSDTDTDTDTETETDLNSFFTKLKNNPNNFISTYLKDFKDDSFFMILRILYEQIGFLHLDFKMKNIFVRYKANDDSPDEYTKFECVIGDLDKSRLQINLDNNKIKFNPPGISEFDA